MLANNAGDTPLDLAIRYNRKGIDPLCHQEHTLYNMQFILFSEAVAVLVDADNEALKSPKIMIEAATKGNKLTFRIL